MVVKEIHRLTLPYKHTHTDTSKKLKKKIIETLKGCNNREVYYNLPQGSTDFLIISNESGN